MARRYNAGLASAISYHPARQLVGGEVACPQGAPPVPAGTAADAHRAAGEFEVRTTIGPCSRYA
jgi:hypothetical protein